MRKKRTHNYSERLNRALRKGPRTLSARALGQELKKNYKDLRGASYGGVRGYSENKVRNPRMELLQAMAETLQIRFEWLAFGEGEMTESLQHARAEREAALAGVEAPQETNAAGWQHQLEAVRSELGLVGPAGDSDPTVTIAVIDAMNRLSTNEISPPWKVGPSIPEPGGSGSSPHVSVPDDVPEEWRERHAIAVLVGRTLRAPIDALGWSLDRLPEAVVRDYVVAMCQALHRLADRSLLRRG